MRLPAVLWAWAGLAFASAVAAQKPSVPLSSSSRWIVDSAGQRVKLRCINWPAHMETNVPEGLHRQTVDYITSWIADEGFNCVRLTFSIDMTLNTGLGVEESFRAGAVNAGVDEAAVMALYDQAVEKNPFLADASLLDVFGAVEDSLWEKGVMTVLDNHVSKAKWCCNLDDGNGWWSDAPGYLEANSRYFDSDDWLDGLRVISEWSANRPGIVGISLRNELRAHITQIPWGGDMWFEKMAEAARIVHAANPETLVVIGGLDGGVNLGALRNGDMPTADWEGKNVWEAHSYPFTVSTPNLGSCEVELAQYGFWFGFVLEQDKKTTGPLFLGEFGVDMRGGENSGLSEEHHDFLTCLVGYMENNDADWALWSIAGTYYIREGNVDVVDEWGALDNSWSEWRNPEFKGLLGRMFEVTQGP